MTCDLSFVAVDVETANAFHGSICQVGLVLVEAGEVRGSWTSLVKPPPGHDTFDPDNVAVHGITAADVAPQPSFREIWPQIGRRLAGRPIVAYNAGFDLRAIREALGWCGLPWPHLDVACSLVLARKRYDIPVHTLDACCSFAGIALERHHDALHDALACARLTIDMARRVGAEDLDGLLEASGVTWGRLDTQGYTPCVSARPDEGIAPARLF